MNKSWTIRRFCVGAMLLIVGTGPAVAEEAKKASPKIDAKAEKVIKQLLKHVTAAKNLSAVVNSSGWTESKGKKREFSVDYSWVHQRPDRFNISMKLRGKVGRAVSDGKKLFVLDPSRNAYVEYKAPEGLVEALRQRGMGRYASAFMAPTFIAGLVAGQKYDKLIENVESMRYVGLEDTEGGKAHRIAIEQKSIDWELLVADGKKPKPIKATADLAKMFAKSGRGRRGPPKDFKGALTTTFKNWTVNGKVGPETFAFTPPPGATKQDPTARKGPENDRSGGHALLGKPAPDFEIPLLEGGKFKLSDLKGKKVVVLDFWATWCGPCRLALPILIKVTDAYKNKGVVFCAVNLREEVGQIRGYVSKEKLSLSVGLDSEGNVAKQYAVRGIPQSVIVGKDGTVQAVHIGLLPDLEKKLTEELEALVAGRSLLD